MKKLFKKIGAFISRVFADARKYVKPGVLIVEGLKILVENPATGVVVAMTKTRVDDVIVARARKILPAILHMMRLTDDCLGDGSRTNDEVIQCAMDRIRLLHPDAQRSTWLSIAGHLSAALSDGKFTFGEVVGLAWLVYHEEVQPLRIAA